MEITKDIIKKCRRGNRKNQKLLFETLYNPILRTCMAYSSCEDQAKEYLQLTFIKIFKNLKKFKNKGSFESWAKVIARHLILDELRKNKKLVYVEDVDFNESKTQDVSIPDDIVEKMSFKQLLESLYKLSPSYRTVFMMKTLDEMTHQEIADELGIHVGTSKSNFFKAKIKLKKILNEVQN